MKRIIEKKKEKNQHSREHGNALFVILIAIALLASLSYAITQSSRSGTDTFTKERTALTADEIIAYGNTLSNAVAQLRLRGCTVNQVSFENNIVNTYTNNNAPTNKSCHIFHPNGAGLTYNKTTPTAMASTGPNTGLYFDGSITIQDIGTSCSTMACTELAVYVRDIKKDLCIALNEKLTVTNPNNVPPIGAVMNLNTFTGTYSYNTTIGDTQSSNAIAGKKSACLQENSNNSYNYYRVLIAR